MDQPSLYQLQTQLANVRQRIEGAALRAGRHGASITLVAITKSVSPEVAAALFELGVRHLGENRVQELQNKSKVVPDATWHLVGPLQSNKIRKAVHAASWLHALDRPSVIESVAQAAQQAGKPVDGLVEVNISGEATKHGVAPGDVFDIYDRAARLDSLRLRGLMTMAPAGATPSESRQIFGALRGLRDELAARGHFRNGPGELSMGMSGDFESAIAEGATMVRIGSLLFEGLTPERRTPQSRHPQ